MNKYEISVLYVEDEKIIRDSLGAVMNNMVVNFYTAENGMEGLELFEQHKPDLVITDIKMPIMGGLEMIESIKKIDQNVNVVITSAYSESDFFIKAIDMGVDSFLLKPVRRKKLSNIIRKFGETKTLSIKLRAEELERKKTEEALTDSEERIHAISTSANDAIIMMNKDEKIISWNKAAENIFEFRADEVVGKKISSTIISTHSERPFKKNLEHFLEKDVDATASRTLDFTGLKKNGTEFPIEFSLSSVVIQGEWNFLSIIRDRTESKVMESKLRKSEEKYREVINLTTQGFGITLPERGFVEINNALCHILGYTREEIMGKTIFDFATLDAEGVVQNEIHRDLTKINDQFEIKLLNKKMEEIYVSVTSSAFYYDEADKIIGRFAFYKDITERKRADEKIKRLYSSIMQELDIASSAQSLLLPKWLMLEDNLIVSSNYTPSTKIGGDLFDIIKISDTQYVAYIADISGHGVEAALLMTAIKSTINMIIDSEKNDIQPYRIMNRLNSILCEKLLYRNYMTVLLALVDLEDNTIRYFNAGHPPIVQYDKKENKACLAAEMGSIPMGWNSEVIYTEKEEDVLSIEENKITFLYTDGIFECEDKNGVQLGLEGFVDFLGKNISDDNLAIIPYKIKTKLEEKGFDISLDDFTLIAFKKNLLEPEKTSKKLFLIGSVLVNTKRIRAQCEKMILECFDDIQFAAKIELIINELLNNIIHHSLKDQPNSTILFQIEIDSVVKLTLWDKGINWEIPDMKKIEENIFGEELTGIFLIYSLATKIERSRYDEINETIIIIEYEKK